MRQTRNIPASFQVRDAGDGNRYIEGYFAVFGDVYHIADNMSESIDRHAFDDTLGGDIRCLTDHDTRLVLGRTTSGTFEVRADDHGLFGRALVNPNDQDAMNTLARLERGDVDQASFGFDILDEDTDIRDDGSVHWTIKRVKLWECSVVTFPAYEATSITARTAQGDELLKRRRQAWKETAKQKLTGGGC